MCETPMGFVAESGVNETVGSGQTKANAQDGLSALSTRNAVRKEARTVNLFSDPERFISFPRIKVYGRGSGGGGYGGRGRARSSRGEYRRNRRTAIFHPLPPVRGLLKDVDNLVQTRFLRVATLLAQCINSSGIKRVQISEAPIEWFINKFGVKAVDTV